MDTSDENSKPGRKPVLDDAKRREICAILAIGGTRRMAAHYVGCSVDTVGRTALRDPAFADQIRKAEVGSEILFLRNLRDACQDAKQWRAATWALERFFPDRYGRRTPRTITRAASANCSATLGLKWPPDFRPTPTAADRGPPRSTGPRRAPPSQAQARCEANGALRAPSPAANRGFKNSSSPRPAAGRGAGGEGK